MKRGGNNRFTVSREITLQFIHFVTKGLIFPIPLGEMTLFGRKLPGGGYIWKDLPKKKVNMN